MVKNESVSDDPPNHVSLSVDEEHKQGNAPTKAKFPWRGGPVDACRRFLVSPDFQAAFQLSCGTFIVALFTFVWAIRFTQSCLSTIFYVAAMLLVAKDSHIGSRLAGSAIILGALWFGSLLAACAVSLGRAPGVAYTTFLIAFTAVALLGTTTLRVKANLGVGVISNLGFGIMLIQGQFQWPAEILWGIVFTRLLRIAVVASLGVFVTGLCVLPSLAGDDLRYKLAEVLKDLGKVVSENAGHLLLRGEDEGGALKELTAEQRAAMGMTARRINLFTLEEGADMRNLEFSSKPGTQMRPAWTQAKGVPSVAQLRPRMARCREIFVMSCLEPPLLRWGGTPYDPQKWPPVMAALDTLLMRVAALDSIIEREDPMMLDGEIKRLLGVSLLPAFRLLFAQIAACCASAGRVIKADVTGKHIEPLLFGPSWAAMEYELAGALHRSLKAYWGRLEERRGEASDFINPTSELRALMYMSTIGSAIMESLAAFEGAVKQALHYDGASPDDAAAPLLDAIDIIRAAGSGAVDVIREPPAEPAPVDIIIRRTSTSSVHRELEQEKCASQQEMDEEAAASKGEGAFEKKCFALTSFNRNMTMRPLQSADMQNGAAKKPSSPGGSTPKKSGPPAPRPAKAVLKRNLVWLVPLVKAAVAWDVVTCFRDVVIVDIPRVFRSRSAIRHTLAKDRWFHFGVKYYAASIIVLGLLLAVQSNYPATRSWNGLYVNITVVVVLSEKVDTTLSKGVLRIATTIAGGILGFLVMLDHDVATNPYGLMAISCALTFLCGLLALSGLKYAIFLLLITFDGLVLCQYDGKHHGSVKNFYTRDVVTVWGVLLCLAFDLAFPWYAASSAMEQMGGSFQAAGEIVQHFMEVWAEELEMGHLRGSKLEDTEQERELGLLRLEKGILQKRIAGPLGAVQGSLEREGVLWKRGALAMPLIVRQSIQLLQESLDRLAAMELMLSQRPIISGRFTGAPWEYLHKPLVELTKAASERCVEMCGATARVMGEFPVPEDLAKLEESIQGLLNARLAWRSAFRELMNRYLELILSGDVEAHPLLFQRSIDDGIRYQSNVFAVGKAYDKLLLMARTVLEDPWMRQRAQHKHSWATWHSWTGNYGY